MTVARCGIYVFAGPTGFKRRNLLLASQPSRQHQIGSGGVTSIVYMTRMEVKTDVAPVMSLWLPNVSTGCRRKR